MGNDDKYYFCDLCGIRLKEHQAPVCPDCRRGEAEMRLVESISSLLDQIFIPNMETQDNERQ